jgi:hypothetical protein
MSQQPSLPDLHDAVLERVKVDLERGVATIDVTRVPGGPARLTCLGFEAFDMSRCQEWGPSVYVNDAEIRDADGDGATLWLEMQSGDVIQIVAEQLVISAPGLLSPARWLWTLPWWRPGQ